MKIMLIITEKEKKNGGWKFFKVFEMHGQLTEIAKVYHLLFRRIVVTLKFPILSATIPASGGMTIATTGVTADMIAVSSTLIPNSLMWIVRYG